MESSKINQNYNNNNNFNYSNNSIHHLTSYLSSSRSQNEIKTNFGEICIYNENPLFIFLFFNHSFMINNNNMQYSFQPPPNHGIHTNNSFGVQTVLNLNINQSTISIPTSREWKENRSSALRKAIDLLDNFYALNDGLLSIYSFPLNKTYFFVHCFRSITIS